MIVYMMNATTKGNTMNAATQIAIVNAIDSKSKKAARAELTAGEYEVDQMVHVSGTVKVSEDTTRTSTSSLINEEFLMLVLKRSGCTRDGAAEIIKNVATEILEGDKKDKKEAKKARKAAIADFDADGTIKTMFDKIKAEIPRTATKGRVKFVGTCEPVAVSVEKVA
jgi:hypothetical protein